MLTNKMSVTYMAATPRALRIIERAARTCYRSEGACCAGSAEKLITKLIELGHEAMLEHASLTVRIRTDRGVTHEIVRHRLASYAQESTRYVNYGVRGGEIQVVMCQMPEFALGSAQRRRASGILHRVALACEAGYLELLSLGARPQTARWVLPTGTASTIVVTMNFRAWRHFLGLRDAAAAHPDMRAVAVKVRGIIARRWPVLLTGLGEGI